MPLVDVINLSEFVDQPSVLAPRHELGVAVKDAAQQGAAETLHGEDKAGS